MIVDLKIGNTIDLPGIRYSQPFYHEKRLDSNNSRFALQWWFVDNKERAEVGKDEGEEVIERIVNFDEYQLTFICDVDFAHIIASLKILDYLQITVDSVVTTPDEWESDISDIADYNENFRKCEITYRINFRDKKSGNTNYTVDDPNVAPVASNVLITGSNLIGSVITGSYTYYDDDGDLEGTSTFVWFRADNASGSGLQVIGGATAKTYTLVPADLNKYIFFKVTPVADTGTSPGLPVTSAGFKADTSAIPVATDLAITSPGNKFYTLDEWEGSYTFTDVDGDLEGSSLIRWYRSDVGNDTSSDLGTLMLTGLTITPGKGTTGKYYRFTVIPVAATGESPGDFKKTSWQIVTTNPAE